VLPSKYYQRFYGISHSLKAKTAKRATKTQLTHCIDMKQRMLIVLILTQLTCFSAQVTWLPGRIGVTYDNFKHLLLQDQEGSVLVAGEQRSNSGRRIGRYSLDGNAWDFQGIPSPVHNNTTPRLSGITENGTLIGSIFQVTDNPIATCGRNRNVAYKWSNSDPVSIFPINSDFTSYDQIMPKTTSRGIVYGYAASYCDDSVRPFSWDGDTVNFVQTLPYNGGAIYGASIDNLLVGTVADIAFVNLDGSFESLSSRAVIWSSGDVFYLPNTGSDTRGLGISPNGKWVHGKRGTQILRWKRTTGITFSQPEVLTQQDPEDLDLDVVTAITDTGLIVGYRDLEVANEGFVITLQGQRLNAQTWLDSQGLSTLGSVRAINDAKQFGNKLYLLLETASADGLAIIDYTDSAFKLSITQTSSEVHLSWPIAYSNSVLEVSLDLQNWQPVGLPSDIVGGSLVVSQAKAPGEKFYRLSNP
jgi:hypothetical protein